MAIQSMLGKVGIQADLSYPDFGKYFQTGSTLNNVLMATTILGQINFNQALSFWFGANSVWPNKNWERTPQFLELLDTSLASREADISLMVAVTDYMTEEALIIPIYNSGMQVAVQPYVKNSGYFTRTSEVYWTPEVTWLEK